MSAQAPGFSPYFTYRFPGRIWKMRFDPITGFLAVETRDPDKLQTFFQVVDTVSGAWLLQNVEPTERWWVGLEETASGFMLLHGYAEKQESGEHVGLQAFDVQNGTLKWQYPELTWLGLLSETEAAVLDGTGQLKQLNLPAGEIQPVPSAYLPVQAQLNRFGGIRQAAVQLPEAYLPEDAHYPDLQAFIFQQTGLRAVQTIEYAETDRTIVISFYVATGGNLANFLVVCSLAGALQLQVCLQQNAAGLGMDTFFIFAEKLFFVQEKSELCGFLL